MKEHHEEFPVKVMAGLLDVSSGGYYSWLKRGVSSYQQRREDFDTKVHDLFHKKKKRYGRRRIHQELLKRGEQCCQKRVRASMRRKGLQGEKKKRYIPTTMSNHHELVSPNILERNFTIDAPDKVWVSDITYLPSREGWLFLVVFIDLYSRTVVGWHVSKSLKHETLLVAFRRAWNHRRPGKGLIIHSDRGSQYCCWGFREEMKKHGVIQSMSRKGNCWDNAVAESFFGTLKKELMGKMIFNDTREAERMLFEYIEIEYNRERIHSTIGYCSPAEFESLYWTGVYEGHNVA